MTIDLSDLRDRLRAALPSLTYQMVELEHSDTGECYPALAMETPDRIKGHVYRMTVTVIGDEVCFFVHVHGQSKDLTTQGAKQFRKRCSGVDEVFAIARACWTGTAPS